VKSLRRALIVLGIVAIAAYIAAAGWLIANETRLLFASGRPLGHLRPRAPFESVSGAGPAGQPQLVWLMRAATDSDRRPWIIFLHGNDANVGSRLNIEHYEGLRALGVNVAAPEYRGFAGMPGVPSEAGLDADAASAYDYLRGRLGIEPRRIVIYGWSLGSGVAVDLAARVDEGGVILEGAPASIVAIGQQRYRLFPVRLLIRNPFDSIRKIDRVHAPMLFLHSPEDAVIPIAEGRRLFDAAPQPKQWMEVAGGHVYASEKDPRFFSRIEAFLRTEHLLP
jgi:fermentation-respiration switch protein FrsA (DUF1100 family)